MSSFNQGVPGPATLINSSNCIVLSNTTSGTALTVQQLGAGAVMNVATSTGSSALFVSSTGQVGVGQTAPQTLLHVTATAANSAIFIDNSITGGATPYNTVRPSASGAGSANCHIWSDGNAVGTSDAGFLRIAAGGGTAGITKSYIDLSGYSTVTDMNQNIVFGTSGSEKMRITSSSNVGIGTTSPGTTLQVYATGTTTPLNVVTASNTAYAFIATANQGIGTGVGATQPQMQFYHTTGGNGIYLNFFGYRQTAGTNWTGIAQRIQHTVDVTNKGYIDFNPGNATDGLAFGSGSTEAMRITSGGNVGINSSGPTASLDISGVFKVNGVTGSPYAQQGQSGLYNWFNGPYQFINLGAGRTDGVIAVYLLTTSVWYFSTASVTLVYYYNTTMNFVSLSAAGGDNFTQSGTYIMNKNNYNSGASTYGINYSLLRLM